MHSPSLLELANDLDTYVVCGITNEILKRGSGELGDAETWENNVVRLGCMHHSREFREIMAAVRSEDKPMRLPDDKLRDDDGGNIPTLVV